MYSGLKKLQGAYKPGEWAFYLDDPAAGTWVGALGAKVVKVCRGERRVLEAEAWVKEQGGEGIFPMGLTFEEETDGVPPACVVFKPKEMHVGMLGQGDDGGSGVILPKEVKQVDVIEPKDGYRAAVAQAIKKIRADEVEKVVLARGVILEAKDVWEPWAVARALKQAYPHCQILVWITPEGDSYIAASPERLLSVKGNSVWTEALAGTAARGDTPEADEALGAALLESAKDEREQALVCAQIVRRLEAIGLEVQVGKRTLRKLPLLQHVLTPISAEGDARILSIVHKLHPTSAVCGEPKKQAAGVIKDLEGFQRGWYAGAFGWANTAGEGHFAVGIRGVELQGCYARIICGAGIIEASDPQKEEAETGLKMKGIVRSLQNTFLLNSCSQNKGILPAISK